MMLLWGLNDGGCAIEVEGFRFEAAESRVGDPCLCRDPASRSQPLRDCGHEVSHPLDPLSIPSSPEEGWSKNYSATVTCAGSSTRSPSMNPDLTSSTMVPLGTGFPAEPDPAFRPDTL